jgi:hypothetical protein
VSTPLNCFELFIRDLLTNTMCWRRCLSTDYVSIDDLPAANPEDVHEFVVGINGAEVFMAD